MISKHVFRLGITGGIGSGKTSVCKVFEVLKIPVFSADRVARKIMDHDKNIISGINSIAGRDLYSNGSLDRMALSSIIFNDKVLLDKVNALVHPVVFESFSNWVNLQVTPYVIMEAAILFESGGRKSVDKVATIFAPVEERIERIIVRNMLTREQVEERIRNQMDDESRIMLSDFIIDNSENAMIIPVILKIHFDILNLIKSNS